MQNGDRSERELFSDRPIKGERPSTGEHRRGTAASGRERIGLLSHEETPHARRTRPVTDGRSGSKRGGGIAAFVARLSSSTKDASAPEVGALRQAPVSRESDRRPAAKGSDIRGRVTSFAQSERMSRFLVIGAGSIGVILALIVGLRSLSDGHRGDIAIIAPPPLPVREKPEDPGGMQVLDGMPQDLGDFNSAHVHLAPGPEQPALAALSAKYAALKTSATPEKAEKVRSTAATPSDGVSPSEIGLKRPISSDAVEEKPLEAMPSTGLDEASSQKRAGPSDAGRGKEGLDSSAVVASRFDAGMPVSAVPPSGQFYIQIGAVDSAEAAQTEWRRIAHRMDGKLSTRPLFIVPKLIRGQTLYRIWVGGYPSFSDAASACEVVKAARLPCYAVRR